MWKPIEGYRWPYRINEEGDVQKFYEGKWVALRPYISGGRNRAMVKMRTIDNRKIEVPLVWLMADAFMGGRRPGMNIIHKNGSKLDCAVWNLKFVTKSESGKLGAGARRRTVLKVAPDGTVVAVFSSGREASRADFISQNAINQRCLHQVKNPFLLNGYTYEYEDRIRRKRP